MGGEEAIPALDADRLDHSDRRLSDLFFADEALSRVTVQILGGQMRRAERFLAADKDLRKKILAELKKGPLQANQFQDHVPSKSPDGSTSGSSVTVMLYHLMMMGEVMVVGLFRCLVV